MRFRTMVVVAVAVGIEIACRENVPDEPPRTPPNSPLPKIEKPDPGPSLIDGGERAR